MRPVPVFLYHSVSYDPPSWIAPFTVTPRAFTEQLDLIAGSGLGVIPLSDLVAALRGGRAIQRRVAVLTFDDGFADFYSTVAPELVARGLPATLYVTTGALHDPGRVPEGSLFPPADMLSRRQVAELDGAGVEIGGHTRSHPQLDTLPAARVRSETEGCKRQLEDVVGHAVESFAYPHGYSSPAVRRVLREQGWSSAAAVRQAFSSPGDDPLCFARLMMRADTGRERFLEFTRGDGAPVAPFPEGPRTRAWRAYRRVRRACGRPVEALPRSSYTPPRLR